MPERKSRPEAKSSEPASAVEPKAADQPPKEYGGRPDGLDPTRYGDWEKNGRCIDF